MVSRALTIQVRALDSADIMGYAVTVKPGGKSCDMAQTNEGG